MSTFRDADLAKKKKKKSVIIATNSIMWKAVVNQLNQQAGHTYIHTPVRWLKRGTLFSKVEVCIHYGSDWTQLESKKTGWCPTFVGGWRQWGWGEAVASLHSSSLWRRGSGESWRSRRSLYAGQAVCVCVCECVCERSDAGGKNMHMYHIIIIQIHHFVVLS